MKNDFNNVTYMEMVKRAQHNSQYMSLNGRDILDFPLHVPIGVSIPDFLNDTFEKYYKLLAECGLSETDITKTKSIGFCIIQVLNTVNSGNYIDGYLEFEKKLNDIFNLIPQNDIPHDVFLYRMRKDKGLKQKKEFYHLNSELRYLCKSERFSLIGYPCLYLGFSETVCKKEISDTGTMIQLSLKKDITFKVLQLTYSKDMSNKWECEHKLIKVWPLIAACYIVPYFCLRQKRECTPDNMAFKEEYIIPQMLTLFLKRKHRDVAGIEYYSVKDVNLDPYARGKNDMRNLMLMDNPNNYEKFVNSFDWGTPYDI